MRDEGVTDPAAVRDETHRSDDSTEPPADSVPPQYDEVHEVTFNEGKTENTVGKHEEYEHQIGRQIEGLNELTANEWLHNIATVERDGIAQETARKEFRAKLEQDELERALELEETHPELLNGLTPEEYAQQRAGERMSKLAALHEPDIVAGGRDEIGVGPDGLPSMGDTYVNSSIGSQWRHRVDALRAYVEHMVATGHGDERLNVSWRLNEPSTPSGESPTHRGPVDPAGPGRVPSDGSVPKHEGQDREAGSVEGARHPVGDGGNDGVHRPVLHESVHPESGDAGRGVVSHADPEQSRAMANEALWKREPPVSPEALQHHLADKQFGEQRAADNARWWDRLSGDEQRALIDAYPHEIGNAEGVPAWARTEANQHELSRLHDELQARKDAGEHLTRDERKELRRYEQLQKALDEARSRAAEHGDEVHILAFDPLAFGGDGRMLVAVGHDPYRADSVSWHVPGYSTTIDSLGGNLTNAMNHLASVRMENGDITATSMVWIGYDAPQGFFKGLWDVSHTTLARAGGDILHGDITAFNAARDAHAGDGTHFLDNHIFGHSYGSSTTGFAGHGGRLAGEVRTVTLLGSPGAGPLRHASEFGIGDNVFVASSSRDWITTLGGTESGRFLGFGLGRDPALDVWGGRRVQAEFGHHMDSGATFGTHSAYYAFDPHTHVRSESLANFGRIAGGHPEQVTVEGHRSESPPGWPSGKMEPAIDRRLHFDDGAGKPKPWDPTWHAKYGEGPHAPRGDGGAGLDGHPRSPGPHDPAGPVHDHTEAQSGDHDGHGPRVEATDSGGPLPESVRPDPVDAIVPVLERYGVTIDEFQAMQERAAVVGRDGLVAEFSTAQLQMLYEARMAHPHPGPGDLIQKVIGEPGVKAILDQVNSPGSKYAGGGPYKADDAGGCVSVAADATGLRTPSELLHGLRMDYGNGSPYEVFTTTDHAYVIEGQVKSGGEFFVPNGRITDHLGVVDPHAKDLRDGAPPHTGTGYTGDRHGLNPEYQLIDGKWAPGSQLVRIDPDGSRHPVARLEEVGRKPVWVSAKEPGDHVVDGWPTHKGGQWVFPNSSEHGLHPDPPAGSGDPVHRGAAHDGDPPDAGPPVVSEGDAAATARVFEHSSFDTEAGAAFYDRADATMRSAAGDVPRYPGEFTIDVHGDAHAVSVWDGAGVEHRMGAREFAEMIRNQTGWDGQTSIRLLSCDTGGGSHPFAAELARELGVAVTAPDRPVWSFPDGREPVVTGFERGPRGELAPRIPPDGHWNRFSPDGRVESVVPRGSTGDVASVPRSHPEDIGAEDSAVHPHGREGMDSDVPALLGLPDYSLHSLSNAETRTVYAHGELRMQELDRRWAAEGMSVEERAHRMFEMRNELRQWARTLMADREAAAYLNANEKMMTWDRLVEKTEAKGFSDDEVFQEIIDSSTRSRPGVNVDLGIDPHNPPPLPPHHGPDAEATAHPSPRGSLDDGPGRVGDDSRSQTHDGEGSRRREIPEEPIPGLEGRKPPASEQEKVQDPRYVEKYYDEVNKKVVDSEGKESTEKSYRRKNQDQTDFDDHPVPKIRVDESGQLVAAPDGFTRSTVIDPATLPHGEIDGPTEALQQRIHEADAQQRAEAREAINRRDAAIDRVAEAEAKYKDEIARNGKASEETTSERKAAYDEQTKAGEALGELAAEHAIARMFPSERYDVTPLHGDQRGSGHFDQVYEVHDRVANETRIVLVEAKSPSGELGTRKGLDGADYQQGHREYVRSVASKLQQGNSADRKLARRILNELEDGNLRYILTRARVTRNGDSAEYDGFSVDQFDLGQA
ncbi:MAG: hypothetical protein H6523_15185 [Mycolicibacterium sp.]|nr:hypothetical protein [Mycolicibacterium sp.]